MADAGREEPEAAPEEQREVDDNNDEVRYAPLILYPRPPQGNWPQPLEGHTA